MGGDFLSFFCLSFDTLNIAPIITLDSFGAELGDSQNFGPKIQIKENVVNWSVVSKISSLLTYHHHCRKCSLYVQIRICRCWSLLK